MLKSVQYLRGFAALLVVIYHAVYKHGQVTGMNESWAFGQSGVDLFFIISGFIMCYATDKHAIGSVAFLKARMTRILPLYWFLSLAALAVYLLQPQLVNRSGGRTTLIHSFTLIPVNEKLLIQNGWTLSYEFFFYFVFAVSLGAGYSNRIGKTCLMLLGLVAIGCVHPFTNASLQLATSPLLLEFIMGMAAFVYVTRTPQIPVVNSALLLVGLSGLVAAAINEEAANRVVVYGLPYMLFFAGFVGFDKQLSRLPRNSLTRMFRALGDSSYSLYLVHPFVLSFVALAIERAQPHIPEALFISLLVGSASAAGYACYTLIESRLNTLFRGRERKSASCEPVVVLPQQ